MKCTKCGNEIPSQSKFCLSCGSPIESGRTESVDTPPKKQTALWAIIAGLVIVTAAALLFAFMTRGARVTAAKPAPDLRQPPVVSAPSVPGAPQPSVLQTDAQKPTIKVDAAQAPPADVVAYLEHLKKVEKARQDVSARELNSLVAEAPKLIAKAYSLDEDVESEPKTGADLSSQASQFSRDWQQIAAYFQSVPAPAACSDLSNKYLESLTEFIKFMGGFQDAVTKSDLAKLKNIRADQGSMDQKLVAADQELGNVCTKFGIQRTFSIKSDGGQTPILGF